MRYDVYETLKTPANPGRTVFLLGEAKDGPVNSPVPIHSIASAESIFGPITEGNLVRYYSHLAAIPNITVYLMRVTGTYSVGSLSARINNIQTPVIKLRSVNGGNIYNTIKAYVTNMDRGGVSYKTLVFDIPTVKMNSRAYILDDYQTLQELVDSINIDTHGGTNLVYASTDYPFEPTTILLSDNNTPIPFENGTDGLNTLKDDLYIALEKTYTILEGTFIDIICPVPARFDDAHPVYFYGKAQYGQATYSSPGDYLGLIDTEKGDRVVTFHEQLIDFCRLQELSGIMTHGVIGLKELEDLDTIQAAEYSYIIRLVNVTAFKDRYGLLEFDNGNWIDNGYYISVFAGDIILDGVYANGCAMYAGLLASLKESETTTNKALPTGITLRHTFTAGELRELSILGVTSVRESIDRGPVVSNGVTASLYQSSLHYVVNIRMTQYAMYSVNSAIEDLIGQPYLPVVTDRELDKRVQSVLQGLKDLKILKDFTYQIAIDRKTNSATITIELMTQFSTEFISVGAGVNFIPGGG